MFYVDSQRTVTRRESSLITSRKTTQFGDEWIDSMSTARPPSTAHLTSDSGASLLSRPWGSVQKEIVTSLFESMLESIVDSWEVIPQNKPEDVLPGIDMSLGMGKSPSEVTVTGKKKKSTTTKSSKTKRSRSKIDVDDNGQCDVMMQSWWSSPDEKAIIHFKNGNTYEGNISMKCMHGEGRFQWADGTVYLGNFIDNEIKGNGAIHWKDDTWYEGEFLGNLRHGKGLYVDSRTQRSYSGGWYSGTKHGKGVIYYSDKNSYDGDWVHNIRHGYGIREYCKLSGYEGEWDSYVRDGKGLMIWPNHDFYKGEWKNGVMSGYGMYIWDTHFNNSMSLPSLNAYRGNWERGCRNGYGILNLGLGLGSHYKGYFLKNKKHGAGKFSTNNGLILQDQYLFIDDILGPHKPPADAEKADDKTDSRVSSITEPFQFDICDESTGLCYHINKALNNIDEQDEIRASIIEKYLENNKDFENYMSNHNESVKPKETNYEDIIDFEENLLRKALRCYETDLKTIYYKYATICNTEEINFNPVVIRLYLWQLYYDCEIHKKGLSIVEIDQLFMDNPDWLCNEAHNPFEKIYLWQFIHSLISVASKLYAKRSLPGPKPDTILASAFRKFMENDVLPGYGSCRGRLTHGYGTFVPLKGLYNLYCSIGEPHTLRKFLCAIHRQSHISETYQPELIEAPDEGLPLGRNAFLFGDEMTFITEGNSLPKAAIESEDCLNLQLFNLGNLSSKAIIKIFSKNIFPQVCDKTSEVIMDLDAEMTFFEFFEGFVLCTEESIRVKEEELRWREKFTGSAEAVPPPRNYGGPGKSKI